MAERTADVEAQARDVLAQATAVNIRAQELTMLQQELDARAAAVQVHEEKLTMLQQELDARAAAGQVQEESIEARSRALDVHTQTIDARASELATLRHDLDVRSEALTVQLNELAEQTRLQQTHAHDAQALTELQHRHDEQTRELHEARDHLARQVQVLQLEVSEFTTLSTQHQSLSQKHDQLAAELEAYRAREHEHLTAQSSLSIEMHALRDREAEYTQTIARLTAAHDAAVSLQSGLQAQLEEARVSRPVAATLPSTPAPSSAHTATPASVSQSLSTLPEDVGSLKAQLEETNTKLRKYATAIKQMKTDKETHMQELVAANNRTAAAHAAHQIALQEVLMRARVCVCVVCVVCVFVTCLTSCLIPW